MTEPQRRLDLESDYLVPLLQAVASGIVGGGVIGVLALWLDIGDYRKVLGGAFVVITAAVWFALLSDRRPALPARPEPAEAAAPAIHRLELTVRSGPASTTRYVELPAGVDGATMAGIAKALQLQGAAFSRPYLCRYRRLLTQTQYHDLRRLWLGAGLVVALPGNRTELTAAGRAVLASYERDLLLVDACSPLEAPAFVTAVQRRQSREGQRGRRARGLPAIMGRIRGQ